MQRFALVLAALWLGSGCCDRCPAPSGVYQASFEQPDGAFVCSEKNAKPPAVVSFDPQQVPSDCRGEVDDSDDNCRTDFRLDCLDRFYSEVWDIEWSCDGESGEGSLGIHSSGGNWCGFWYDVTLTKLE